MDGFIDLHVHSHYSDGMASPADDVRLAKRIGLKAVTLSDHDTVKGVAEAETEAAKQGIEFVRGIEVSTFDHETPSMHMLGLLWQNRDPLDAVEPLAAKSRADRNIRTCAALKKAFGYEITIDEIRAFSRSSVTGTGHLCRAMVAKGYAADFDEAVAKIKSVKDRQPYGIPIEDAVKRVHEAKGLAVLAHPGLLRLADDVLYAKIKKLKDDCGLDGIECYHTKHSDAQIELYLSFAKKLDMAVSGGSDYHAAFHPEIALGKGKRDDFFVPYSCLEGLCAYHARLY